MNAIIYTNHARTRMREYAISEEEVIEVLEMGNLSRARFNRQMREKVVTVEYRWQEHDYPHKEVRVVYVQEQDVSTVITVRAPYGIWRGGGNLRITYDAQADAVYIYLTERIKEPETREVDDDIILDFDAQERLVGIEVLDASKRLDLNYLLPVMERLDERGLA